MKIPNDLPIGADPHWYRCGWSDGYKGKSWVIPFPNQPDNFKDNLVYMRGYNEGKRQLSKLKGGVGV